MTTPIEFFAEVEIQSADGPLAELDGRIGVILGRSQDEETAEWGYAVHVDGYQEVWDLPGSVLRPTGRVRNRDEFYDGSTLRVRVDPVSRNGDTV